MKIQTDKAYRRFSPSDKKFGKEMFSVKHNECVGFESKWKVKKVSANNASQTAKFSVSEKGCNTAEQKSAEIQTDTEHESTQDGEVDMEKLAEWLNRIYPNVIEQINRSNNSRVFRGYKLTDGPVDSICRLVQNINVASKGEEGSKAIPIVACLQWNNSGKCLAVAYNYKHKTWCHHIGIVCIYILTRQKTLSETAKKRFSTESCVTSVKFHPIYSTILAAGTFTGHIYVWNIENDVDPLICNILGHDEYITHLSWIHDIDSPKNVCLASSSTDGLIKLWNFNITENILQIKIVFKFKTPIFGMINRSTEVPKSVMEKGTLGVVCFDFSRHVPDMFLVAMEGGLIARCSVLGITKVQANGNDTSYYDPVVKYYESHKGEIVAVKFSLHKNDMFLTSGTDGEIRIYLVDQDDPAQIIFTKSPLNDISFIMHEEKLLAACGQNGTLEIFHLISGKPIPATFDVKITKRRLTSMAINNSFKTNYVVIGNNNGEMQLWDVPWQGIELGPKK